MRDVDTQQEERKCIVLMHVVEEETRRVLKKQRLASTHLEAQLDGLLQHVEATHQQLEHHRRRKSALSPNKHKDAESDSDGNPEQQEDPEVDEMVQDFMKRVHVLNVEKNVTHELKSMHVLLSKYVKLIDKTFGSDMTKICWATDMDHTLLCRLVAEYLYQNGQIEAADTFCNEAEVQLPSKYRTCFVELHTMLDAFRQKNLAPALAWARKYRKELARYHIEMEFELVRLQYVDTLEQSADVMDAVQYANQELSRFHETHANEIGRLLSCVLFKNRLNESPYKDLFVPNRWERVQESLVKACCRLHKLPHRPYLQTCIAAGVSALPAMRKLVTVIETNLTKWETMDELPVEIPIANEHRFHTVFACPVSKEESTPENPPMLLKCGHVICKSCVKKISSNFSRRFKCPTCPMEQLESETRELFF